MRKPLALTRSSEPRAVAPLGREHRRSNALERAVGLKTGQEYAEAVTESDVMS
jgi:hypothetical protein